MANNSISLVNLDFDTLKAQLKTYLKGQAQFSDYDFDGSNMSVLLDILTYNTHLNAFYLNMVASEMFLESAQLKNSVVSIAKSLNYTPRSAKSARAKLNLQFPQSGLSVFTIPKGTRFSGKNSVGTYQFVTIDTLVLYPSGGKFTANGAMVYEGIQTTDAFITDYAIENQRFILSNESIDTDSIEVLVTESNATTPTTYSKATSLFGLNATSKAYFVQAAEDSSYEIVFGDGTFGARPTDGSTISITYRVTSGPDGNKATNFLLSDNLGAVNGYGSSITPTITVVETGYGGAESETIEEIRYRAPRAYQTQDRAITVNDFKTLITQEFQAVKSVYVYGGEQVTDYPKYGTVYVVPITFTGNLLSEVEKIEIEQYLKERTALGVTPKIVDPNYLYVNVYTTVKYAADATSLSASDIESLVKVAIQDFNTNQLSEFNSELSLSRLEAAINDSDASITTNQTELTLTKLFQPELNKKSYPLFEFRNPIVPGSITSKQFTASGKVYQYVDFNPNNDTLDVKFDGEKTVVTNTSTTLYIADVTSPNAVTYKTAGTVDYNSGKITMDPITVTGFGDSLGIELTAKPTMADVRSALNDITTIDTAKGITVKVRKA
jgi:hypothetical protein